MHHIRLLSIRRSPLILVAFLFSYFSFCVYEKRLISFFSYFVSFPIFMFNVSKIEMRKASSKKVRFKDPRLFNVLYRLMKAFPTSHSYVIPSRLILHFINMKLVISYMKHTLYYCFFKQCNFFCINEIIHITDESCPFYTSVTFNTRLSKIMLFQEVV